MKFPKLAEKKIGATVYKVCDIHGLQNDTTEDGTCLLCDRVCRGCGELKETVALEAALMGAGFNPSKDHEHCEKKTDGYWMEREAEEPDAMLISKDSKFN